MLEQILGSAALSTSSAATANMLTAAP